MAQHVRFVAARILLPYSNKHAAGIIVVLPVYCIRNMYARSRESYALTWYYNTHARHKTRIMLRTYNTRPAIPAVDLSLNKRYWSLSDLLYAQQTTPNRVIYVLALAHTDTTNAQTHTLGRYDICAQFSGCL